MFSARTSFTSSRRRRIIIVPRAPQYAKTPRFAMTAIERSLTVPPTQRTPMNIEAIFSLMKTWPNYTSFIKIEEIQRELCHAIYYEKYKDGNMIFKPGDLSDGWYFVFKGKCILVEEVDKDPENTDEFLPDEYKALFKDILTGRVHHFRVFRTILPTEDFGSDELKKMCWRNCYCITVGSTEILKIDPYSYKYYTSQYKNMIREKKADVLTKAPKLEALLDYPDASTFLAEKMKECKIDKGFVISKENPLSKGFLVVEKGLIIVKRKVNFDTVSLSENDLKVGDISINIPNGYQFIQSEKISDYCIMALPEMYSSNDFEFYAEAMTDTDCYLIEYKDFFSLVPINIQNQILNSVLDHRSDEEVIHDWLENKKNFQWRIYKKKCQNEAKEFNSVSKGGSQEQIYLRIPKLPISLGNYRPRGRRTVRFASTV